MKSKKADGINKLLELHNSFPQKNLTRAIFLLAPAANMLDTSRVPLRCMIWQHAVILESICKTNLNIIFLPTQRTGLLAGLLTSSPLLFFSTLLFGQIISKSNFPFSHFFLSYPLLLPLESKHDPLTLSSVLACADSADELRF